jgi:hypothetical protein
LAVDSYHHEANHPETKRGDRRKDILAFRTIMHLSKAFMLDRHIKTGHVQADSKTEEMELQLSSAFASLAVLEHEDLAVAVKEDSWTNPHEPVNAIITSTMDEPMLAIVTSTPQRMNGVVARNLRSDDRKVSASTEPMLSTPNVPRQFKEFEEEMKKRGGFDDANILNQYIDKVLHLQG